jgi:hypothetical protein
MATIFFGITTFFISSLALTMSMIYFREVFYAVQLYDPTFRSFATHHEYGEPEQDEKGGLKPELGGVSFHGKSFSGDIY